MVGGLTIVKKISDLSRSLVFAYMKVFNAM